jgi:hypothetical protein
LQLLLLCTCLLAWGLSACASLPANSSDQSGHTSSDASTATPSATQPPAQPGATAAFALAGKNLLVNGDAESGPGTDGTNAPASVPGWQVSDGFNVIVYGSPNDLPTLNTPGPANRGKNFFYGGLSTEHSSASQIVDVSSVAPVLSTGQIKYTLSGWIGGLAGQNDHVELTARFLAVDGSVLGTAQLPTVLDNDRHGETELLFKTATGLVPAGTVKIQIQMDMIRTDGADNDAYADNLSLVLGA